MDSPLVSVGMPVYNGGRYIEAALDSLLSQSYGNFELNISDNASTDETETICRAFCAKDSRVHYYRNPQNIGSTANWHRSLQLATGDFFMWAACDDRWSHDYVECLLDCLLSNPTAALAAGKTVYIDGVGNLVAKEPNPAPDGSPGSKLGPARQLLEQYASGWLHGLFRRSALAADLPVFLSAPPFGDDIVFLLHFCLTREVVGTNTAVMYKRISPDNNSKKVQPKTPREIVGWQFRFSRVLIGFILNSSLPVAEKIQLLKTCIVFLKRRYLWGGVAPWVKTCLRAGCHWVTGVNRP